MNQHNTMKYYQYDPNANEYAGLRFKWQLDSPEEKRVMRVHGTGNSVMADWVRPVAHGFDDNPPTEGDFPSLCNYSKIPVMSQRAWDALRPLIGYCCEALPIVHYTGDPYYIIHVMDILDALDEERSEYTRNGVTGRINQIYQYSFHYSRLQDKHIFQLPLKSGAGLIVSDVFRKSVEEHGLLGLRFQPVKLVED